MFLTKPKLIKVGPPTRLALFDGATPGFVPEAVPDLWVFEEAMVYKYREVTITIPKGCTTDFASTPKALDWIPFLDIQGLSRLPGALHDGIYRLGRGKGKDFADNVLYDACLSVGLAKWQAAIYYQGVHLFGKGGWDEDAAMKEYGSASAKFAEKADYDAWHEAGEPFYS
jgi:hypothetical protein